MEVEKDQLPAYMTARHLKEYMGIGIRTAYEMMHGPLSSCVVRVGKGQKGYRIVRDKFFEWVEAEAAKPLDPPIPGRGGLAVVRRA